MPGTIDFCPGHRVELGVDLMPEMGIQVFRVEDGFIVAVPPCCHQRHTHTEPEVDMTVALLPRTRGTLAHRIAFQSGNIFNYESETVHEYCTPIHRYMSLCSSQGVDACTGVRFAGHLQRLFGRRPSDRARDSCASAAEGQRGAARAGQAQKGKEAPQCMCVTLCTFL